MKKLLVWTLLIAMVAPLSAKSQTLTGFMAGDGFAGAKLSRRLNRLVVPVSINNKRGTLLLDTGAPVTVIDKSSLKTFGLTMTQTKINVEGVFGRSYDRFGVSKVKGIAMGNCTLTNVPVAVANESDLNYTSVQLAHVDGFSGASEMVKFGMVIDCTRQMLYINPNGRSAAASQKLASFLASRGFTRVPLHLNSNAHFDVQGALNGHPTRFIVDTGAETTMIDRKAALAAGIGFSPGGFRAGGAGGQSQAGSVADIKELSIGDFKVTNAEVAVAAVASDVLLSASSSESNSGLLGVEWMSLNFGILDLGGGALYLRHPDKR